MDRKRGGTRLTCKFFRRALDGGKTLTEPPTSACFDCGALVPITEAWHRSRNPEIALCETCFRRWEASGRARRRRSSSR